MERPAILVEGRGDSHDACLLPVLPIRRLSHDSVLVSVGDDGFSPFVSPMGGEPSVQSVQLCRIYEFEHSDIYNQESRYSIDVEREQESTERIKQ